MNIPSLHIAQVKNLEDPELKKRVLVTMTDAENNEVEIWALITSLYATTNGGFFFMPEIGDKVLIGFIGNDQTAAVILGSLYTEQSQLSETSEENNLKAIVTRSRMQLSFDEDTKTITLVTPGGNSISLNDEGKCIELKDQNSNRILMNDEGIRISSHKSLTISAQNVKIDSSGEIKMTANTDFALKGTNVHVDALMSLHAKGTSSAELSASGEVFVKGAMVMIN